MRARTHVLLGVLGSLVLVGGLASVASAGCADPSSLLSPKVLPGMAPLRLAALPALPALPKVPSSAAQPAGDGPPIVGLWKFTFTSQGNTNPPIPDGAMLDTGYAQWHGDGTEIMNSFRDPATSNFCLGVWTQDGGRTYKLNHWALSWDNTSTFCTPDAGKPSCFVGAANIRETVTVEPGGAAYSGMVTIDQYNADGSAIMFTLHGTVSAQRIKPE